MDLHLDLKSKRYTIQEVSSTERENSRAYIDATGVDHQIAVTLDVWPCDTARDRVRTSCTKELVMGLILYQ